MECEQCGRDTYPGHEHSDPEMADQYDGLDLCEGCDMPTDACTCEPL